MGDYGVLFYGTLDSLARAGEWKYELLQKDYLGSTFERRMMEQPLVIQTQWSGDRDSYQPITPSTAEVNIWDATGDVAAALATPRDRSHVLRIYAPGILNPAWVGYLLPEPTETKLNAYPDSVIVQAIDGLALLKQIPFLKADETFHTGNISPKDVICRCLQAVGLGLPIWIGFDWWTPQVSALAGGLEVQPLEWTSLPANTFKGEKDQAVSCEEVLLSLLVAGTLELRQSPDTVSNGAAWHVVQPELLFAGTYYRHQYDDDGSLTAHGAFDPVGVSLAEAVIQGDREENNTSTRLPGYQAAQVSHEHGPIPVLNPNPAFEGEVSASRFRGGVGASRTTRNGQGTGRGGVSRSGGDTAGRGGVGRSAGIDRGFYGRGNPGTANEIKIRGWFVKGGAPINVVDILGQKGPSQENVYNIKGFTTPITPAIKEDAWNAVKDAEYIYSDSLTVVGGPGGHLLRMEAWSYIEASAGAARIDFPVFMMVQATEVLFGAGTPRVRYLNKVGEWIIDYDASPAKLDMPGPVVIQDGPRQFNGGTPNAWNRFFVQAKEYLPTGYWTFQVRLYPAYDFRNSHDTGLDGVDAHYWTNVYLDAVKEDGTQPESVVVTALDPDSDNTTITSLSTVIGDPPVIGMYGGLLNSDGSPTGNWQRGRYSGEPDSGRSITEMAARTLYKQQSEALPLHDARYIKDTPIVWPHQVLEIEGVRYKVGGFTYTPIEGLYGGTAVKVGSFSEAPTIDILREDGSFVALGGFSDDAGFFALLSDSLFNRALQSPLALTNAVILPGPTSVISASDFESDIEAGDKLVLITPDGRHYQFEAAENRSASTATDIAIGEDGNPTQPFIFDIALDFPAGIFARHAFLRSLLIQTSQAIRATLQANAVGFLNEDIPTPTQRTTLATRPLRMPVKKGRSLVLAGSTPSFLIVDADAEANDTSITIKEEFVSGKVGDAIVLDGASLMAELLIQAHQVLIAVREERKQDAVAVLTAAASGSPISLTVAGGTKNKLLDQQKIILMADDGNTFHISTVDGTQDAGVTSITIVAASMGTKVFPVGTPIKLANFSMGAEIALTAEEVLLRAYETDIIDTWVEGAGGSQFVAITGLSPDDLTLTVNNLPSDLASGSKIHIHYWDPNWNRGEGPLIRVLTRLTTLFAAENSTTIKVQTMGTIRPKAGDWINYDTGAFQKRLVTNEGSISVQAAQILSLLTQWESSPNGEKKVIGTLNTAYAAESRATISISITEDIAKYDTLLIWNKANADWYEVRALEAKSAGFSGLLSIENPIGGGNVTLTTSVGDVFMRGTFSALRQTLQGFTFHSRYLKIGAFNGTISDEGAISTVGTQAGVAFGGGGDFAFVKDATNYIWWNGTNFVIRVGSNGMISNDPTTPDWWINGDGFYVKRSTTGTVLDKRAYSLMDVDGTTVLGSLWSNLSKAILLTASAAAGDLNLQSLAGETIVSAGAGYVTLTGFDGTRVNSGNLEVINGADLIVDTNTLFVDASANRVGIVQAAPAYPLDVTGIIRTSTNFRAGSSDGISTTIDTSTNPIITVVGGIITAIS